MFGTSLGISDGRPSRSGMAVLGCSLLLSAGCLIRHPPRPGGDDLTMCLVKNVDAARQLSPGACQVAVLAVGKQNHDNIDRVRNDLARDERIAIKEVTAEDV